MFRRRGTQRRGGRGRRSKRGVTMSKTHYYANTYPTAKHTGNDWRKSVEMLHGSNIPKAEFIGSFRRGRLGRTLRSVTRTAANAALRRAEYLTKHLGNNTNIIVRLTEEELARLYALNDKQNRTQEEDIEFKILRKRYRIWLYGSNVENENTG